MDELLELHDSIFAEFGEDVVRSIADCIDFDKTVRARLLQMRVSTPFFMPANG